MRILTAIALALPGLFVIALAFDSDPCDRESAGGYVVLAGSVLLGFSALILARRPTWRPWVAWAIAIGTTVVALFGISFIAIMRWVSECAN